MAEREKMSKLRGLSRRINKGKKPTILKVEKVLKVRNGYLKLTFPLTPEQFKIWDMFVDYMMSFVYGDRSMDDPEDAEEWEVKVKQYVDELFGVNSYYKCFGDATASHTDIGVLFEQINNVIAECRKELKKEKEVIDCLTGR